MKRVLVVEDNKDNLKLISYALEKSGYEVISAETGEEGIELALKENYPFILMDIDLPGIDGVETTKRMRASGVNTPIIAITSYAMSGDKEKVMEAGCNGYFEKPINPITIMDSIHEIVLKEKG
jgi:CheY-like chemotaxis protein